MVFEPLRLRPCYKGYLWGGERLKREFHKQDAPEVTAESWELACHTDGKSVIDGGAYDGMSLLQLSGIDHDGYWGKNCQGEEFPLLVKFIDAKQNLSVQVHPSDASALPGERGKAEMWYIVECEPQSYMYLGFSQKLTRAEFLRRAKDGSILEVLNKVPVSRGDVFYILPGTVHSIGAGIVIAEIQQNSSTTFRIYDFGRRDAQGQFRPLHLDRAAQVLSYDPISPVKCRANNGVTFPAFTLMEMFSCPYFRAFRVDVQTEVELNCDGNSFQHLLCVEGAGRIISGGKSFPFIRGDSFFLPAALGKYRIQGRSRLLLSWI